MSPLSPLSTDLFFSVLVLAKCRHCAPLNLGEVSVIFSHGSILVSCVKQGFSLSEESTGLHVTWEEKMESSGDSQLYFLIILK